MILAFDTSTAACSAAVVDDGRVLAGRCAAMARGQSEALVPMVVAVLREAGVDFPDLDVIGVTVGPGAFTGVRIGLAAARAMGLAAARPVAGLLTSAAIALTVPPEERRGRTVLVVIDAKRADVFVQPFDQDLVPLAAVAGLLPEALPALAAGLPAPPLLVGCGVARVAPLLPDAAVSRAGGLPEAALFAAALESRWRSGAALPPEPVYLRPPDVTLPKSS